MAILKQPIIGQEDPKVKVQEKAQLTPEQLADLDELELLTKLNRMIQVAQTARRKFDWEWLVRDLFIRGYQFARYSRTTNTFTFSTRNQVRIPINLVWSQMRSIRSQITAFRPKWEVLPQISSQQAIANADFSSRLLDYLYDKLQLRSKIKELITFALKYSVGFWQVVWDEQADNGKGEIAIRLVDPYDLYIDPSATSLEDAEFVVRSTLKPIDEIKKNPAFK